MVGRGQTPDWKFGGLEGWMVGRGQTPCCPALEGGYAFARASTFALSACVKTSAGKSAHKQAGCLVPAMISKTVPSASSNRTK